MLMERGIKIEIEMKIEMGMLLIRQISNLQPLNL